MYENSSSRVALGTPGISRRTLVCGCAAGLAALLAGSVVRGKGATAMAAEQGDTITIEARDATSELTQIEVPYDPQRLAILDFAAFDVIGALGLQDRVVGSASTTVDYLQEYLPEGAAQLGTIKEANLEAVMSCEPDVIFIGGRLSASYDALNEIAPVVYLSTDESIGLVESVRTNATMIASIFGMQDVIAEKMTDFDQKVQRVAEVGAGSTAIIGMVTSGSFNALGNNGCLSLIVNECGFENMAVGTDLIKENGGHGGRGGAGASGSADADSGKSGGGHGHDFAQADARDSAQSGGNDSARAGGKDSSAENPHGEEASYETIVKLDPDYIFVMDRDQAIGTQGAQYARDVMDNDLINSTRAYQDGHIVYLEHSAVWYTAEGGITALEVMLQDLYDGLGIQE